MDDAAILPADKVQDLSDLELAALLCLVAEQHCIIQTHRDQLLDLEQELKLICSNTFGLTCAILNCSENTTIDDFGNGLLVEQEFESYFSSSLSAARRGSRSRVKPRSPGAFTSLDTLKIADIVIAKDLNLTSHQVQIQALELMRGKRIFTRTAVHTAPKRFLFIALLAQDSGPPLSSHLNDYFFISHLHSAGDNLINLEELHNPPSTTDDSASESSVVKTPSAARKIQKNGQPLFPKEDIDTFVRLTSQAKMSAEIRAYLHNIVVFLRLHRGVAGGISALATRHFHMMVRALAPLHKLTYISPSLVALAARKVYRHRIILTTAENERSVQWGSSVEAIRELLDGITVEDVIEETLQTVEGPL